MKRRNTQTIGEVLKLFFEDNAELYEKMLEIRIQRGWGEILGPMIMQYTKNIYVKNHVLYVSLTSSVLRSELTFSRDKLVKSLNEYAGANVIHDIIIR
jgi:predicted nucleic acid-binding Zn ribbon protein